MGDGDIIGEIAFQTGRPFTADIVALTETRCLALDKSALTALFLRNPLLQLALQGAFIGRIEGEAISRSVDPNSDRMAATINQD